MCLIPSGPNAFSAKPLAGCSRKFFQLLNETIYLEIELRLSPGGSPSHGYGFAFTSLPAPRSVRFPVDGSPGVRKSSVRSRCRCSDIRPAFAGRSLETTGFSRAFQALARALRYGWAVHQIWSPDTPPLKGRADIRRARIGNFITYKGDAYASSTFTGTGDGNRCRRHDD